MLCIGAVISVIWSCIMVYIVIASELKEMKIFTVT
jgi:hypothetical protein